MEKAGQQNQKNDKKAQKKLLQKVHQLQPKLVERS